MTKPQDVTEVGLCRALAGVDSVSSRFASSVIAHARERHGDAAIDALVDAFATGGLERVSCADELSPIARSIVYALYTGMLPDVEGAEVRTGVRHPPIPAPEDHFESVLWRTIQAHPPGLSGGYFGHWHYPPEDHHG